MAIHCAMLISVEIKAKIQSLKLNQHNLLIFIDLNGWHEICII